MYEYRATLERVVDGDTVDLMVDTGFNNFTRQRFRLAGIDAPESRTRDLEEKERGLAATKFVEDFFADDRNPDVLIETGKDQGKFGRWIVTIYGFHGTSGALQNLNKLLVSKGHAMFKQY